jgi:acyl phosphate:glycerol-3-phosphate acyltransferase
MEVSEPGIGSEEHNPVELTGLSPAALCIFAFLLGALPFGFLAGKIKGVDIREHGSRNIGATNVMRVLGKSWGIAVLLLDALKGYLPVILAGRAGLSSGWLVGIGLCAILGHIYSPFVRFRGGKGVATSLGVLLALSWQITLITLAVFLVTLTTTRWVSLGSMLGALTQAILFFVAPADWIVGDPLPYRLFGAVTAVFIIVRHRANLQRLLAGTEPRFGEKAVLAPPASPAPDDDPPPTL